jgi:hypothetical protein
MHIFEYQRTREIKSGASQPQHYQPPKHATNHHHHIHNVKQHSVTPEGWWARVGWEDIAWGVRWLPRFNSTYGRTSQPQRGKERERERERKR